VESSDRLKIKVDQQKRSQSRGRLGMMSMQEERPNGGFFRRNKPLPISLKYDRIVQNLI